MNINIYELAIRYINENRSNSAYMPDGVSLESDYILDILEKVTLKEKELKKLKEELISYIHSSPSDDSVIEESRDNGGSQITKKRKTNKNNNNNNNN